MNLKNLPIPESLKKGALAAGKTILRQAGSALNRVDELGGEARDFLFGKLEEHPKVKDSVDGVLNKFRNKDAIETRLDQIERDRREVRMANEAKNAPPPTAAELAEMEANQGLGDASLSAQIYGRKSCPWTGRAITLLERDKVDYDYVDLDDPEFEPLVPTLIAETKQNTVPYIYLRGEFIGGFNGLDELKRLGQLEERLKPRSARSSKVEVAARPNTDETAPAEADPRD